LALLVGVGFFVFTHKKDKVVKAGGYSVANEVLPPLDSFITDQSEAWKQVPLYVNRARVQELAKKEREPQQERACPPDAKRRDANAWLRWRRKAANTWNEDRVIERSVYREIAACEQELKALSLWNCFTNIRDFAKQATLTFTCDQSDEVMQCNHLGFEVSDVAYYKKMLDYDKETLKIPEPLDKGIPDVVSKFQGVTGNDKVKSYEGLAKINAHPNWKVMKYMSRTVNNPHPTRPDWRSFNRLLFLHSTPRFDKWIQFTLPRPTPDQPFGKADEWQQLVDFISVEKVDKNGNILAKPVLRFAQFNRDETGKIVGQRLNPKTGHGGADKCYMCHPGGMRYMSPLPSSVGPWQSVKQTVNGQTVTKNMVDHFNDTMASYKTVSFDGAINPEYYGPPRGETVGCMDCHNNGHTGHVASMRRGPINHGTDPGHVRHKLRADFSMSQARLKGHLAVLHWVRGVDRISGADADTNKKLNDARKELFTEWHTRASSLDFETVYKGATKVARVAEAANLDYIPPRLKPDATIGESMDRFIKETAEDQKLIEQILFQQSDERYKIETANWMEDRCPDTPIEGEE